MKFILIIFVVAYTNGTENWGGVATAEFDTEYACLMAIDQFRAMSAATVRHTLANATCAPKSTQAPEGWTKEKWSKDRDK
jgi:hypothetical protein